MICCGLLLRLFRQVVFTIRYDFILEKGTYRVSLVSVMMKQNFTRIDLKIINTFLPFIASITRYS